MNPWGLKRCVLLGSVCLAGPVVGAVWPEIVFHQGACDASGAVALDGGLFAAASDEENVLRVYEFDSAGLPIQRLNLNAFLEVGRKGREVDIEGAARVGDRIYWVTSHGSDKEGRERSERRRFFATAVVARAGRPVLEPVGRPYGELVEDFGKDPRLAAFKLSEGATRAPHEPGALNIEGLAAWREGQVLLGFRSPVPGGRALLVPLVNPAAVVEQGDRARFGPPLLLDLNGRGIRDAVWTGQRIFLVAGGGEGGRKSRVYEWTGGQEAPRRLKDIRLDEFNAEAVAFMRAPDGERLWLFSDDGRREAGGTSCRDLEDPAQRSFRSLRWPLVEGGMGRAATKEPKP